MGLFKVKNTLLKSSWFRKSILLNEHPMKIPSDFAVARSSENWFSMAQDYYFATKVLRQSYLQARIDIKSVTVFDEKGTEVLAKTQILNPLLLLMGHCIELQVKSLCIKIKGDELITPLKMQSHTIKLFPYVSNVILILMTMKSIC